MNSFSVANLRSIKESGEIELKPLTVLLGKNSCGKSSLLQVLPLMKQTISKKRKDPILWFDKYVDFGSFKNSISSQSDQKNDSIKFTFSPSGTTRLRKTFKIKNVPLIKIEFEIKINRFERISIDVADGSESVKIDLQYVKETGNYKEYRATLNNDIVLTNAFYFAEGDYALLPIHTNTSNLWTIEEENDLKSIKHSNKRLLVRDLVFEYEFNSDQLELMSCFDVNAIKEKATKVFKDADALSDNFLSKISNNILNLNVYSLLDEINEILCKDFSNVVYFKPLRASGDRFYRVQGLDLSEIDSDGFNAPMYLFNLSSTDRVKFNKWCHQEFGFSCFTKDNYSNGESTSVFVKIDGEERNLTDVGFGFSQIFPIVLSIWININSKSSGGVNSFKTIIIEQPELHLHPALQKRLINVFIKLIEIAKQNKVAIRFLLETHSETIVNYLGRKIVSKELDDNIVNFIVCKKENNVSSFDSMRFDDSGYITNWPIGFFTDED